MEFVRFKTANQCGVFRRSYKVRVFALLLTVAQMFAASAELIAAELKVAVASNFFATERALAAAFEQSSGHKVITTSGSTGKLFAQISRGAPYDIFLAADTARPARLIKDGIAEQSSYYTYAIGRLGLWSRTAHTPEQARQQLLKHKYKRLALANPKTAPYGKAADEVLATYKLKDVSGMIRGENINMVFQYIQSGHADIGFIAGSQAKRIDSGTVWWVPGIRHQPIKQAAVIIKNSKNQQVAEEFRAFMTSKEARNLIYTSGYGLPVLEPQAGLAQGIVHE